MSSPAKRAVEGRVLVVDDHEDIRFLLVQLLERAGYQVDEAADGRDALRMLAEADVDVVVLDLHMPGLTGWQTLEAIRGEDRFSGVGVLLASAGATPDERARAVRLGADDYVEKPFDIDGIVEAIAALGERSPGERSRRRAEAVRALDGERPAT